MIGIGNGHLSEVIDKLDNLSIDELATIIKTIRENGLDKDRNSNDRGDI